MEEMMRELIEVVDALNMRTWWDYLIVIAPILISIIAIIVSITTTRKQNKIAIFEKGFEIVYLLAFILSVCDDIIKNEYLDKSRILQSWMEAYWVINKNLNIIDCNENNDYFIFYTSLIFKLYRVECLFKKADSKLVVDFLDEFNEYILKVQKNEPSDIELEKVKKRVSQIEQKKVMDKLEACIKL